MAIWINSSWAEYEEAALRDKAYLLSLSEKERKKELKKRKIANDKSNAFFKKIRKQNKPYIVGTWTPLGPFKKPKNEN
jgi:CRISPR/Cas system CMR subunit Cmr6 (Cas7 group RAMP superfamily)